MVTSGHVFLLLSTLTFFLDKSFCGHVAGWYNNDMHGFLILHGFGFVMAGRHSSCIGVRDRGDQSGFKGLWWNTHLIVAGLEYVRALRDGFLRNESRITRGSHCVENWDTAGLNIVTVN